LDGGEHSSSSAAVACRLHGPKQLDITKSLDKFNRGFVVDAKMGHSLRRIYPNLHLKHERFHNHILPSLAKRPPSSNKRSRYRLPVQKPAQKQIQLD